MARPQTETLFAVTHSPKPLAAVATAEAKTGFRFFIVSVAAFFADFALALTLRETLGLSVTLAAAIGFVTAWLGSYFGHEYWTFARAESGASMGRFVRNLVSNAVALTTRLLIIFALESFHAPETTILAGFYLLAGAGCSFTVNFLINRFWVFAAR